MDFFVEDHVLAKVQNRQLQDFQSEPLRRIAVFPFQIFEPPRPREKTQAAKKTACLFLSLRTNFFEDFPNSVIISRPYYTI
jgi:hypothetical protein